MIRVTTTLISCKFQKPFQASKHRIKGVAAKNLQAIKKSLWASIQFTIFTTVLVELELRSQYYSMFARSSFEISENALLERSLLTL